ncbi:RNA polymerase sigma factor [Aureimonas leprariae]|uniref:RNA polymerase sigma factor n=1 Tax=Plantimonas leprariae TaxID=2615207 RepID=A0A7V7TWK6_9HYPH|nr:RNA polymerase sigma factor [Aureimonas leprariae]KAB0679720.1 RNA polymerase sigma factor [Aureimonas leprariae]
MAGCESDEALLARIAGGEAAAERAIVARKLPRILGLAVRMLGDREEAEDVSQEAFVRIWRQAPRWRSGEARFDTWLHTVVLNLCRDRLRRKRELTVAEPPEMADPTPGAEQHLVRQAERQAVAAALAALPERQREAIVLQYYQELSNGEAAAVLGISVEALESLLSRARRTLRDRLANEMNE